MAEQTPVATFYNPRFPNDRVLFREDPIAMETFDLRFKFGKLDVYTEEEAAFIRNAYKNVPGPQAPQIFEDLPGRDVECAVCAEKRGRDPIFLNAAALNYHMKVSHAD